MMIGLDGLSLVDDQKRHLKEIKPAGVILFARNYSSPDQISALVDQIKKEIGDNSLLVAVDQEGGRVNRLREPFTIFPSAREIGATGNDYLAYETGRAIGNELLSVGINLDFAPVMDVDSNPSNPVIGDRSFGSDPYLVARMGMQMIAGMQDSGILTCAKHFPGHGDTSEDSHFKLPSLEHDLQRLSEFELIPFESAVDSGVDTIMTAHIIIKGVDSDNPATMSAKLIKEQLKLRMGFSGVVVSDDLEMKAISDNFGLGETAARCIKAGVDLLLVCKTPSLQIQVRDRLVESMMNGDISDTRMIDALDRISALKSRVRTGKGSRHFVGCEEHARLVKEIKELAV